MTLPDPKVLNAYLKYYFSTKEAEKTSWSGWMMSLARNLSEGRKQLQTHFSTEFTNASNVDRWLEIIIELGKQASKAQKEKSLGGDSLFCKTLHAMRSYIIYGIRSGGGEDAQRFETAIQKRLILLNQGVKATKAGEEGTTAIREQYYHYLELGLNLETPEQAFHDSLLELSYLDHVRSIGEAKKFGLFEGLFVPDQKYIDSLEYGKQLNKNLPLCFQPLYYVIFYIQNMKSLKNNMMFSDFEASAKLSSSIATDKLTAELAAPKQRSFDFPNEASSEAHSVATLAMPPRKLPKSSSSSNLFQPQLDGSLYPPRKIPAPKFAAPVEEEDDDNDDNEQHYQSPSLSNGDANS